MTDSEIHGLTLLLLEKALANMQCMNDESRYGEDVVEALRLYQRIFDIIRVEDELKEPRFQ